MCYKHDEWWLARLNRSCVVNSGCIVCRPNPDDTCVVLWPAGSCAVIVLEIYTDVRMHLVSVTLFSNPGRLRVPCPCVWVWLYSLTRAGSVYPVPVSGCDSVL